MANPWLKKNPFMSMWLSAAHRAAAPLRGQAAALLKRQAEAVLQQALTESLQSLMAPAVPAAPAAAKAGGVKRKRRPQAGLK